MKTDTSAYATKEVGTWSINNYQSVTVDNVPLDDGEEVYVDEKIQTKKQTKKDNPPEEVPNSAYTLTAYVSDLEQNRLADVRTVSISQKGPLRVQDRKLKIQKFRFDVSSSSFKDKCDIRDNLRGLPLGVIFVLTGPDLHLQWFFNGNSTVYNLCLALAGYVLASREKKRRLKGLKPPDSAAEDCDTTSQSRPHFRQKVHDDRPAQTDLPLHNSDTGSDLSPLVTEGVEDTQHFDIDSILKKPWCEIARMFGSEYNTFLVFSFSNEC